jgi:hypothetical protein
MTGRAPQTAPSPPESEPVLPAVFLAETRNALIVGDQRTIELYRRRNQKPVRRIPVLEMMQLIAAAGGAMAKRHGFDAGTLKKALEPGYNGKIKIDPSRIDQERDLPGSDGAEQDRAAGAPAAVDEAARGRLQSVVSAVEPESNMGVEQ